MPRTDLLFFQGQNVRCTVNNKEVMNMNVPTVTSSHGFIAVGTSEFKTAMFDNLKITSASDGAGEGSTENWNTLRFNQATQQNSNSKPSSDHL